MNTKIILHGYWGSSCTRRVRIALNLKGINYEFKSVNILKGQHLNPDYEELNPAMLVPTL